METKTLARVKVGPNLFQVGGNFYLRANVRGQEVFEPLKATNKTEAKTERDRRLGELRTVGIAAVGDRSLTFDALAEKFIEHERGPSGTLSARTCELRETLLRKHVTPVLGR